MKHAVYFKKPTTLKQIAELLSGKYYGDSQTIIKGIASSEEPVPDCIVFTKGKNATQKIKELENSCLACIGVEHERYTSNNINCPKLLVKDTSAAVTTLLELIAKERSKVALVGISKDTIIHPSAQIDSTAYIGPNCTISEGVVIKAYTQLISNVYIGEETTLGEQCILHANVSIREKCIIGNNVVMHNGAVIGADGFGFVPTAKGIKKVPQLGIVTIEDQVEIGAVTSIDRATIGSTKIGFGTKIDNQVQVGHNVQIGKHCILCACTKIGGSSVLGDGVICGGGTGIADHMTIVSGVRLGGAAQVVTDILEAGDYAGSPACKASLWRRALVKRRNE